MSANTAAKPKPRAIELLLSPVNNSQLANLCGVLDENLRQIETAFDISIARFSVSFHLRQPESSPPQTFSVSVS